MERPITIGERAEQWYASTTGKKPPRVDSARWDRMFEQFFLTLTPEEQARHAHLLRQKTRLRPSRWGDRARRRA